MPFVDRLTLWLGRVVSWCFAAIVLIMVYEVVARYALQCADDLGA